MNGLHIVATGRSLPATVVTNEQMSHMVDTSDEWIVSRTGIRERRLCRGETNVQLASEAAAQALERAGIEKEALGACVVSTFTSDYGTPSVACMLQKKLALPQDMPSLDINAACSGFLYGLQVARGLLLQGEKRYALVVGSELLSRVVDFEDRSTCVLFGDGAGAAVVELDDRPYYSVMGAQGNDEVLYCPGIGNPRPFLHMAGGDVFRFAVDRIPRCIDALLSQSGLTLEQIDYVVCHQANERIIRHVVHKLGVPMEKFYMNLAKYGNTSSASIPIALDEMYCDGLLQPGMKIICVGFGGGFTWGGVLMEV